MNEYLASFQPRYVERSAQVPSNSTITPAQGTDDDDDLHSRPQPASLLDHPFRNIILIILNTSICLSSLSLYASYSSLCLSYKAIAKISSNL